MNINNIKAVVFDCDGVMFDTSMANRMFYNHLLEYFGKDLLTDEQFLNVHMFTVEQALKYLFPEMLDLDKVYSYINKMEYNNFIPFMTIEPDLKKLVLNLKKNGYITAVATNRTNTMKAILDVHGLLNDFDMVVTAANVKKPKPYPDELLKIQNKFNLKPDEILFIGDSKYDELAGLRAGTFFAAFKNSSLKADFYIDNLTGIQEILTIKT
ncbi:MAG: haloacid dehalogenase [Desulfobacteraceae bacterium 4572_130]|nr:MAG: haloacid dehalogenase [Desulfobacteraceae bacterium 4572_130]